MIPRVTVSADKNPHYSTNPGNITTDKVFLLSIKEVNKYFSSDKARECATTYYAITQAAYTIGDSSEGGTRNWWWLRSPAGNPTSAAAVSYDGSVYSIGLDFDWGNCAIRPALWINLGS